MGALLKLMGKARLPAGMEKTALAKIQAPDAGLIKPDNELTLPETYIPKHMNPEEFKAYQEVAGDKLDSVAYTLEATFQILANLDIRLYPNDKVKTLLHKQLEYYLKAVDKEARDIRWRPVFGDHKYENAIPVRIIKLIKQLQTASENRFFQGNCDPYGRFAVSDISKEYGYRLAIKGKTLIHFLAIELFETSTHSIGYQSRYSLVIDAWRGPTFSDEEAKI